MLKKIFLDSQINFIKPDYEFNTDGMLKVINKFETPTGLYSIADGQSENLLPTYWGLRIRSKLGQEIGKKEAIISRIMQCQTLDGLCNFVSENNIEPTQSYAANAIYKLLEGDKEIHNTFGNISDISPRGRYCYSYFVKDTKSPEQIKNFISQIQDSLKESVQEIRFPKLYMSYFQIVSLKNLNQPIDKSVIEELSKNLEKIDTRGLGRMEKFLFCMLENLIRKEIDAGYSVSKEAKEVVSDFMNAENYKDKEFENDTLLCLYMCIEFIADDASLIKKYNDKGLYILEQLLTDDGLFCLGVANREANYDSTFMGLEVLNNLS